ncbi:ubiquitin carboxyl-terminal hydrolase 24-like [Bidens hawaiensis]|uniref:ubiquitin carboxyl-terminal hydrolase 24-like n=1 Tax=Bidens hawaiensis TaxID=980011 RepID=UPI00404AF5F3
MFRGVKFDPCTYKQVIVFGSFTEDETRAMQSSPKENDALFMFGSLDAATLRSVGFNNIPTETEVTKLAQTLKHVKRSNASETVNKNGNLNIHDSSSLHFSNGVKEHEHKDAELPVTISAVNQGNGTTNQVICSSIGQHTELLPRGLVNSGNLCFLNATLQALLACSPFVHLLQELRTRNVPEIDYPTLHAFVEFITEFGMPPGMQPKKKGDILLKTGKPLRPVMFESVLNNFSPDMPNSFSGRQRQEDAQEFLSFVMHQMHDELHKLEGQIPNGGKVSLVSSVSDAEDDSWETVGPRNKTTITRTQSFIPSKLSHIFGGQLKSVVKARGNKPSATIQPFLLLHLNICPDPVNTIEDALHLFSAPETLEGYCASSAGKAACSHYSNETYYQAALVSASKSVKILELPEIIILHLMRFSYGSQGSTKLLKPVYFPLDLVLNRDLLVSPTTEGRKYELVATITHHGTEPSNGHYTADILHSSGKWLHFDDSSVNSISTNKVLHDQAYVLFYKQQ